MEILKYKKSSNNIYEVILSDGSKIKLYDETIIKYNLLNTKRIDDYEEIVKYNNNLSAYYNSLKYLSRRIRSKEEIRKYLNDYPRSVIDKTINRLEEEGYIDDDKYLSLFVSNEINVSNNGKNKIISKLVNLGLDKGKIKEEISKYEDILYNKLDKLIDKKINNNKKYNKNMLRNKILIDLSNLGYDKNDILTILDSKNIEEPYNILDKEYVKAYKILSRKYKGEILRNKLIIKLVSKGFDYESVKKYINI